MKNNSISRNSEVNFLSKSDFDEFLSSLKPLELQCLWESIQDHEYFSKIFEKGNEIKQRIDEMEDYINEVKDAYQEVSHLYNKMYDQNLNQKK